MFDRLVSQFPDEDRQHLSALAEVWSSELGSIVERMLDISHREGAARLPQEARPEAIFELAKLVLWLEERIVQKKTATTCISEINPEAEREALLSRVVQESIENTARTCAEHIWMKFEDKWWKKFPAVDLKAPKREIRWIGRDNRAGIRRQHFSPASSNKRWTTDEGKVRVYSRGVDGKIHHRDIPAKSWGREHFLYSQRLEHLFSLIEGDAGTVYKKLLEMIPITEADRRHWVAFLAAQLFRTPAFILKHLPRLKTFIESRGIEYSTDVASLRRAYETLFTDNRVFAFVYRLVVGRQWEIWSTANCAEFLRSDDPVAIEGSIAAGDWRLVYPMTPMKCFVAGPGKHTDQAGVVPLTRQLDVTEVEWVNRLIAATARRSVIGRPRSDDAEVCRNIENSLCSHWEALSAIGPIFDEHWGDLG